MGPWRRGLAGLAVGTVIVAGGLVTRSWWTHDTSPAGAADGSSVGTQDFGAAPAYTLTDHLGRAISSTRFAGKAQVVAYLFPYCTTYCPITARTLALLSQRVAAGPLAGRVEIVAFNVDPGGAGPAQLRAFWQDFGGNPTDPNFEFLTGSPAQIQHVVRDGFHVFYGKVSGADEQTARRKDAETAGTPIPQPSVDNPVADRAKVGYDIVHNDYLDVVGPHGKIRRIYDQASAVPLGDLYAAVAAVAGT